MRTFCILALSNQIINFALFQIVGVNAFLKGFYFSGLFIHNMVSILMATLMEISNGRNVVEANALANLIDGVMGFIQGKVTTKKLDSSDSSYFFHT